VACKGVACHPDAQGGGGAPGRRPDSRSPPTVAGHNGDDAAADCRPRRRPASVGRRTGAPPPPCRHDVGRLTVRGQTTVGYLHPPNLIQLSASSNQAQPSWKPQLTASLRWLHRMDTEVSSHDHPHRLGESATHPIEPRCGTLAALFHLAGRAKPGAWPFARHSQHTGLSVSGLSLAGMSPPRRRALPAHRITAPSGASNCGFQDHQAAAGFGVRPRAHRRSEPNATA
jgi:hypothetical protein